MEEEGKGRAEEQGEEEEEEEVGLSAPSVGSGRR
jgi:hypothetical protein